jgi:hypothetical protein
MSRGTGVPFVCFPPFLPPMYLPGHWLALLLVQHALSSPNVLWHVDNVPD